MSEKVLAGCKNNASGKKKRISYNTIEEKVITLMNDLNVRAEATKKIKSRARSTSEVRSASEAGLPVNEENPSKVDRTFSPTKV